jgi:tRNA(Ile)-lysidine synthase
MRRLKSVAEAKRAAPAQALANAVTADEFATFMEVFAPPGPQLALAVSGGPDSMALAFCLKRWRDETNARTILALIVDHALRAESAPEAEQTRTVLGKLGIDAEIFRWQHPPVASRLHIRARAARYELLAAACRARGIAALVLGHQREDQAETILMRIAKGSGIDGLRGIDADGRFERMRLLRPFLSIPRARCEATCRAHGIAFISDPSNASQKYARGRLRRVMPLLAEEGLATERLCDLGARTAEAKEALDHYTHALLRVAGKLDDAGVLRLDLEQLRAAPRAVALRALDAALRTVNPGFAYGAERASLLPLLESLCADNAMPPRTLHGCLVAKTARLATVIREYAAIAGETPIGPGETVMWDGRWEVTLDAKAGNGHAIRPLGHPPHALIDQLAPGLRHKIPQGRVRATLPALWRNEKLAIIPALPGNAHESTARAQFLPSWPPIIAR